MTFPDLPPDRIPGSPGHLNDHQLIDQALEYVQQAAYRDDPNFPPLPDIPVLGQSGHVTAHDRILAVLEYLKDHPVSGGGPAVFTNTPTGTYSDGGHTYAYVTFTQSGTLTVATGGVASVLIVGGGGGGGSGPSGTYADGGNGGAVVFTTAAYLPAGQHAVTVGEGGAVQKNDPFHGVKGGDSSIEGIATAYGGGGGNGLQGSGSKLFDGIGANGEIGGYVYVSITDRTYAYGEGGPKNSTSTPKSNRGGGGSGRYNGTGTPGASGVVVVRVQTS